MPQPCSPNSADELSGVAAVFMVDCNAVKIYIHCRPMKLLRLIAIWLLMLALPMQGLAAISTVVPCSDTQNSRIVAVGHDSHAGNMAHSHEHPASPQQPDDQAGGHPCCNHVFSAVPSANIPGAPVTPHIANVRVPLLATIHIPELPQRPPRA
jgi:hypothetical protein